MAQSRTPDVEIERKYLLSSLPDRVRTSPVKVKEIWQGWIPGQRLQERLRRVKDAKGERFFRTVKLGRGIERIEVESVVLRQGDAKIALQLFRKR